MIEIYTLLVSSEKGNTKWENSKYDTYNFIFIFRTFSTIHFHTYPELHRAHLCFKKIGTKPNRLSD